MSEIKKKLLELIAAALIGFSDATNLRYQTNDFWAPPSLVIPSESEIQQFSLNTSYRGKIQNIAGDDLLGTGNLFKSYSARIFSPDVEDIFVIYDKKHFGIKSDLFHVYKMPDQSIIESEPILFPGGKSILSVNSLIEEINDKVFEDIIESLIVELRDNSEISTENTDRIIGSIEKGFSTLQAAFIKEIQGLRNDINTLNKSLDIFNQRALAVTPDHLSDTLSFSMKQSFRETPKRLMEGALDDAIKKSAKFVAKVIAAAFIS
jgi:hypothetical protein